MEVPSGRTFTELDLAILPLMAKYGFIEWRDTPFELESGVPSHVYVFGREDVTDHPDLEWLLGRKIALAIKEYDEFPFEGLPGNKQVCLIGIPTAGTALAQAASMVSYYENILVNDHVICHRVMKEALKTHGANPSWVNGNPQPKIHIYGDMDNVVTDGTSKFEARDRLAESGYSVSDMFSIIFVDRQQGGIKKMEQGGFNDIIVVYLLLDLTYAFGELKLWPKSAVKAVEEEIKAHQV